MHLGLPPRLELLDRLAQPARELGLLDGDRSARLVRVGVMVGVMVGVRVGAMVGVRVGVRARRTSSGSKARTAGRSSCSQAALNASLPLPRCNGHEMI